MDAALDETFLPRDAQGGPKMGEGKEEPGVKEREGVLVVGLIEALP